MEGDHIKIKIFPAQLMLLHEMLHFIRNESLREGFGALDVSMIELAVEEALVNIIKYGYSHTYHKNPTIHIECSTLKERGIKIVIRDQGFPYNPLDCKINFNPQSDLEDRAIGGYGIFFIMNLMDQVYYQHEDHINILTLIKHV